MSVYVDLREQVKKILQKINGGTGNDQGWSEGVVQRFQNNSGSSIPIGSVVRLYTSGSGTNNGFVIPADTEEGEDIIGIVQGTYEGVGPIEGQFLRSAPADGTGVAVMTAGTSYVLTTGTITKGNYAYVSGTAGKAKGMSTRSRGAFGRYVSQGSNSAYVRLPLTAMLTGSETVEQYENQYVTDLVTLDFSSGFAVHADASALIAAVDLAYENFELNASQIKVADSSNYYTGSSSGTETLRPSSDIATSASGSIVFSSGSTGWNLVDESVLDTADYYKGTNDGVRPWYIVHGFPATALTTSSRITSITIKETGTHALGTGDGDFYVRDPQTGQIYLVNAFNPGGTQPETYTMTTRPWDGRAWTVDDCRHLQMGAGQAGGPGNGFQVYQLWLEIAYTTPVTVERALQQVGAGGGGGSHTILSATHTDTLAGTVVRGDQMVGNSTPKWGRVPIAGSAPSNAVWISDGTDARWEWPAPVKTITSSSSNVFWGQVDFRAGSGVALAASSNTITISSSAGAGGGGGSPLTVTEVDGSPSVASVTTINFPNDSVTDNGSGTVTIRDVPQAFIGARVWRSTTQTPITAETDILFDSEDWDTDGFHSTSSNTERLTVPAGMGGKYLIEADIYCTGLAANTNYLAVRLYKNTSAIAAIRVPRSPDDNTIAHISTVVDAAAGDYFKVSVSSDDVSFTVNVSGSIVPHLACVKLDSGKVGSGIGAKAYNSAVQNIADNTLVALTLNTEEFDTDAFHDTGSNTARMTIPTGLGGKYLIVAGTYFNTTDADGVRVVRLRKNGTTNLRGEVRSHNSAAPTGSPAHIGTWIVDLVAGDYVELMGFQNSGAAMDVGHATNLENQTHVSIMRLDSGAGNVGVWTDYTPTWTTTGTAPAIGNGILAGRYQKVGQTCHLKIFFQAGSTTTFGTGDFQFSLPFTNASGNAMNCALAGYLVDQGTAFYGAVSGHIDSGGTKVIRIVYDTTVVNATGPYTWSAANSDQLALTGFYEIA